MLAQRELALPYNNAGVPAWEDHAIRHGWPLATRFIRQVLGIRPGIEVEDEDAVWRELDFVAESALRRPPATCAEIALARPT